MTAARNTVTLLFTDLEDSTRLGEQLGDEGLRSALERSRDVLRATFEVHGGREFGTEGDAQFVAFQGASTAVLAAVAAQRALGEADDNLPKVRIGVHTGEPLPLGDDFVGLDVHRVARVRDAASGGQVFVSHSTAELVDASSLGVQLVHRGRFRLKGLTTAEDLFEVLSAGQESGPAPRAPNVDADRLPRPPTRLIGREAELSEAEALIRSNDVRLLTLHGEGGVGKTRMAIALADRMRDVYADGLSFVPLEWLRVSFRPEVHPERTGQPSDGEGKGEADSTSTRSGPAAGEGLAGRSQDDDHAPAGLRSVEAEFELEPVAREILSRLGVSSDSRRNAIDELTDALAGKRILLLLDACEHLPRLGLIASTMLERCPGVKILATSRLPLRIRGERLYPVAPLPVPSDAEHDRDSLLRFPSVEMFRSMTHEPDDIPLSRAEQIALVCRRLDGLPLAIELAAARARHRSLDELLEDVGADAITLASQDLDRPPRQRTLSATLKWSYDLLAPAEQAVFRRMSVFAAPVQRRTAVRVAADAGADEDSASSAMQAAGSARDVEAIIDSLIDHSLLRRIEIAGVSYLAMLEVVRDFGRAALSGAEARSTWTNLVAYWRRELGGPGFNERLSRLEPEAIELVDQALPHLRGLFNHALEDPETRGGAVYLAAQLNSYWLWRGLASEGADWIDQLAARRESTAGQSLRAWAMYVAALLVANSRGPADAKPFAEEAERLSDGPLAGASMAQCALVASWMGDREAALAGVARAEAILEGLPNDHAKAVALSQLGEAAMRCEANSTAERLLREALSITAADSYPDVVAITLWDLSQVAWAHEDADSAWRYGEEAVDVALRSGSSELHSAALANLGLLAVTYRQDDTAADLFQESAKLVVESGVQVCLPNVLTGLASIELARGNAQKAASLIAIADRMLESFGLEPIPLVRQIRHNTDDAVKALLSWSELREAQTAAADAAPRVTLLREYGLPIVSW